MNNTNAEPLSSAPAHTSNRNALPKKFTEVQLEILHAVADIQYGSVEIVIQDGKVVQIESREKRRIPAGTAVAGPHSSTSS